MAPALLDHFLAGTNVKGHETNVKGYGTNVKGQQSPRHDPPPRESSTWEPVYGAEVQAHGSFDDKADARSPELLWVSTHRGLLAVGALGVAAAAAVVRR